MGKARLKIPKEIENDLLFNNDLACCICQDKTKGVVIHHIDGNPLNNSINNLAVLCQEHHDKAHGKVALTKNLTPELIFKYKFSWESFNLNKRQLKGSPLQSKSGIEKVLFEFEIRKTAYEFLSLDAKNTCELKQRLEYLYNIHVLEGYTIEILSALQSISILVSFENEKAGMIAEDLHHYVWHLLWPKEVPLSEKSKRSLDQVIDILGTLGCFSSEFNKDKVVIDNLLISFRILLDISVMYNLEDVSKRIFLEIEKIMKKGKVRLEKSSEFNSSIQDMKKFLKTNKILIKQKRPK